MSINMAREERLKNDCDKLNVPYIFPQPNATKNEDDQRINKLRRRIADERGRRLCAAKIIQKLGGNTPNPPSQRLTSSTKCDNSLGMVRFQLSPLSTLDHLLQASLRANATTSRITAAGLPQRHSLGTVPTTIFVPSCEGGTTESAPPIIEPVVDHAIRTPLQIPEETKQDHLPPTTESTKIKGNMKKRTLRRDDDNERQPESRILGMIGVTNYGGDPDDQPTCKSRLNTMTLLELCTLNNGASGCICLDKPDSSSNQSSCVLCLSTMPPKKRNCLSKSREGT